MQASDEFKDADEPDEPQRVNNVVRERRRIDGVSGGRWFQQGEGWNEGTLRQYWR